jgi:hypothetical protein
MFQVVFILKLQKKWKLKELNTKIVLVNMHIANTFNVRNDKDVYIG